MAVRSRQMVPSTSSRVLIQANREDGGAISGVLYNPYLDVSRRFVDVVELSNRLDEMFDTLAFPQAASSYRAFPGKGRGAPGGAGLDTAEEPVRLSEGDKNVFVVHVKFRQNASWQGTVMFAGAPQEQRFRSTLELLKILDDALQGRA